MVKNHLKRIASPRTWPIKRKQSIFIAKPQGAHSAELGLPLNVAFRELMKISKSTAEVREILLNKTVKINGKQTKNTKQTFGLLDILTIEEAKVAYTVVLNDKNKLEIKEIPYKEADVKLSKVIGKTYLKNKKVQLNLHDGINLLVEKDECKVGDTIVLSLADKKVKSVLPLAKGSLVYLVRGKHTGATGVIESAEKGSIVCKLLDCNIDVVKDQIVVIGKTKPVVSYFETAKAAKTAKVDGE